METTCASWTKSHHQSLINYSKTQNIKNWCKQKASVLLLHIKVYLHRSNFTYLLYLHVQRKTARGNMIELKTPFVYSKTNAPGSYWLIYNNRVLMYTYTHVLIPLGFNRFLLRNPFQYCASINPHQFIKSQYFIQNIPLINTVIVIIKNQYVS